MRNLRFSVVAALLLAACASAKPPDGQAARPVKEVVVGSARVRGGGMRIDVQVGRPLTSIPVMNATTTAAPNAAVTP